MRAGRDGIGRPAPDFAAFHPGYRISREPLVILEVSDDVVNICLAAQAATSTFVPGAETFGSRIFYGLYNYQLL
jgi:hypothetical protein